MRLTQKLTKWFDRSQTGGQIKASQTAPLLVQFGGQSPRFTPRQYDRLAEEGYQKNVIVYRCVRLISQNAASVPWVLYRKQNGKKARF